MELVLAILLLSASVPHPAQSIHAAGHDSASTRTVFVGRVRTPQGRAAHGVEVETSAGGACVTAADGSFELAVDLPPDVRYVDVTAAVGPARGTDGLSATARVLPASLSRTTSVGVLRLVPTAHIPRWLPEFDDPPGTGDTVRACAVFDDGTGPALYVAGDFAVAGSVPASRIARWDGTRWWSLGSGTNAFVRALATFDDGSGPALYAAGGFTSAGGGAANRIARWDGASWSPLGSGTNGDVFALTVFDDGSGPALYAAGAFTSAGGGAANRIAKWDGASWTALGSGADAVVRALAAFDDGSGPALAAGGDFTSVGGVAASRLAKWDGASWTALGIGVTGGSVHALAVFEDGTGAALYAGGEFTQSGSAFRNHIAKWDGADWVGVGGGLEGFFLFTGVRAFAVFDDGTGPALGVGGHFMTAGGSPANHIAKWDGSSWAPLGGGMETTGLGVLALCPLEDESGPILFAGGQFARAEDKVANDVARWDGSSWATLGKGLTDAVSPSVRALAGFDDGGGPALYAAGLFDSAGGGTANRIARWDGASWSALGSGLNSSVQALVVLEDQNGAALYAGGSFTTAGGVTANRIAKWDGASWSALGSGMNAEVQALVVFDDGSGPALHAGGSFTTAGGVAASRVAKWDGASWSALGSGVSGGVSALVVLDDGSGPALFAGGTFTTAGGVAASRVAKWNGASWSPLGSGPPFNVGALAAFDAGNGLALHAGCTFGIQRWDGSTWETVGDFGGASSSVRSLVAFDDGNGPALFAAGAFTTVDGLAANLIARFDGMGWSALGGGLSSPGDVATADALVIFDDGIGPALYVGGTFVFSPSRDSNVARWGPGPNPRLGRDASTPPLQQD